MTYRIRRGGEVFGPYAAEEVYRLIATGNIVPTDLAQVEGRQEWLAVGELFPAPRSMQFPNPPDLPWWIALILGIVTGGLFFVIWDIVEAEWIRRVSERSVALALYVVVAILYVLRLPEAWHIVAYNAFSGPPVVVTPLGHSLGFTGLTLAIAARFVFRNELLRHFNGPEPLGLRLNAFWTLVFGGLYFQFHFNRINEHKRIQRMSMPRV
jgi:hypothetical protein